MAYRGKERRRRFVYVTRNTEYHVMDDVCIAVRDLRSGRWLRRHPALGQALVGGVRIYSNGAVLPSMDPPSAGDPIYFVDPDRDDEQVITSRLETIDRPKLTDLVRYPAA